MGPGKDFRGVQGSGERYQAWINGQYEELLGRKGLHFTLLIELEILQNVETHSQAS